jgi:hypothetical protein
MWHWEKAIKLNLARYVTRHAYGRIVLPDGAYGPEATQNEKARGIYQALSQKHLRYSLEPYSDEEEVQPIRDPIEIFSASEGTCLELSLLYAGLCIDYRLIPLLIVLRGHAFIAVSANHGLEDWDSYGRRENAIFDQSVCQDVSQIRALIEDGSYIPVECTGFTSAKSLPAELPEARYRDKAGLLDFDYALDSGRRALNDGSRPFDFAIDLASARFGLKISPAEPVSSLAPVHAHILLDDNGISLYSGDVSTVKEPELLCLPLPETFDAFKLLSWRTRLTELVGQEAEMQSLVSWAESTDKGSTVRLLSGLGGAGKSRMAAEVAMIMRERGCSAGFVNLFGKEVWRVNEAGLVAILDYPEQHIERTLAIIKSLGALDLDRVRIRLLLLSRFPLDYWQSKLDQIQASYIVDSRDTILKSVTTKEALQIYKEAVRNLNDHYKVETRQDESSVQSWLESDPALHCRPLFSIAAALHSVFDPSQALQLGGRETLSDLARREKLRLESLAVSQGLAKPTLTRLISFSALRGDLDQEVIARLSEPSLKLALPPVNELISKLQELPHWDHNRGILRAPQPDLLAACLLEQVLRDSPRDLRGEWVWATVGDDLPVLIPQLERVAQDINQFGDIKTSALLGSLSQMSAAHHKELKDFPQQYGQYLEQVYQQRLLALFAHVQADILKLVDPECAFAHDLEANAIAYERERKLFRTVCLADWPVGILVRQMERGERIAYFVIKEIAGMKQMAGEPNEAAHLATKAAMAIRSDRKLTGDLKGALEVFGGYSFAAGCLARSGEGERAVDCLTAAFSLQNDQMRHLFSENGLRNISIVLLNLLLNVREARASLSYDWVVNKPSEFKRHLGAIAAWLKQLTEVGRKTKLSALTDIAGSVSMVCLKYLLGPKLDIIMVHDGSRRLEIKRANHLALALSDAYVLLSNNSQDHPKAYLEALKFIEQSLSAKGSEASRSVAAQIAEQISTSGAGRLAELHKELKTDNIMRGEKLLDYGAFVLHLTNELFIDCSNMKEDAHQPSFEERVMMLAQAGQIEQWDADILLNEPASEMLITALDRQSKIYQLRGKPDIADVFLQRIKEINKELR